MKNRSKSNRITARENYFIVSPDKSIILRVSSINGIVENQRKGTSEPYYLILDSDKSQNKIPISKENFEFLQNELTRK